MKTVRTHLVCDTPECGSYEYVDESKSPRDLKVDRKKRGWSKIKTKDYCPKCSDLMKVSS